MVSTYSIMYVLLAFCVLLQNLFFHIINPTSTTTLLLMFSIISVFIVSQCKSNQSVCRFSYNYIKAIIVVIILPQTIYGFVLGQSINDYIDVIRSMLSILLVVPVLKVMIHDGKVDKVLNMIQLFTIISLGLLLLNSFILNETGIQVVPFDYFAMPPYGRAGRLRLFLISDFLSFVSIYSFANIMTKNRKTYNLIAFAIAVGAEAYIEQTRMILVSIIISCLIMFTTSLKKRNVKILFYFCGVLLFIYGFVGDWYSNIYELFSISNSNYGVSTLYRLKEIAYAPKLILEHPFLGTGMIKNYIMKINVDGLSVAFDHTDIGLLGTITYIGLGGAVVLFIWPFVRMVKTVRRVTINRDTLFALGLVIYVAVTAATIVITDNARIFAWPFIIATLEFCRNRYTTERKQM